MDYEDCLGKISKIQARKRDRERFLVDTLIHRRWKEQKAAFVWSKENVQKLLAMNEALTDLSRKGIEAIERVYGDLKRMLDSGKKDYVDFNVDISFSYEGEWPDSEYFTGWFLNDDPIGFGANDTWYDFSHEKETYLEMNWNILGGFRDIPEFAGQHICYLMYRFFDGKYGFQDALKMEPDDFCYIIETSL